MRVQLMYPLKAVKSGALVTEAIIAFDERVEADWPIQTLQAALAACYSESEESLPHYVPQIYIVRENGSVVGYLIRPAGLCDRDARDLFWRVMLDTDGATETDSGYDFKSGEAFMVGGWYDDVPVAAIGFIQPGGMDFPNEPFNEALRRLMRQSDWPKELLPLYPYQVNSGTSSKIAGLWIATTINDLNDMSDADDNAYRAIFDTNGLFSSFGKHDYQKKVFNT